MKQNEAIRVMLKGYSDVLDVTDVSNIMMVSKKTVYQMLKENKIRSLKAGRSYRIPKVHLIQYLLETE